MCAIAAATSIPFGLCRPVVESETAITVAPSSARNFARKLPTLPKPCTATVRFCSCSSFFRTASWMQYSEPRAVASSRPSEPPTLSGLPVTTPSTEWPLFIE